MRIIFILLFSILTNFDTNANPLIDIRYAKHEDKTRIVFETLNKPKLLFQYEQKKILLEIQSLSLKNYTKSNLVEEKLKNYHQIENIALGDKIIIRLKQPYDTKYFILPPSNDNKNYRIVLDILSQQLKETVTISQSKNIKQSSIPEIESKKQKNILLPKLASDTKIKENEVRRDVAAPDANEARKQASATKLTLDTEFPKKPNVAKTKAPEKPNAYAIEPEKIKIILDPGHGGKDTGTKGLSGILEKQLTLQYAIELKKHLSKYKNLDIILTRKDDSSLSKFSRNKFVDSKKPDLFISLHADSHSDPNMRGLSVYTLSEENYSDEEAKRLAENEDKSENKLVKISANNDTEQIMNQLIFRHTLNSSAKFAKLLTNELENQVLLLNNSHRFANFRVLKNMSTPSILIELGYLSNKDEEKLLRNNIYKKKIIGSIANSITKHFNIKEEKQ